MRIVTASFLLAMLSFTMACPTSKPVTPVPDASDAQVHEDALAQEDGASRKCHEAFLHLQFFNCPEGDPRDVGENFEQLCNKTQRTHEFDLHPDCINKSKNVDDLRASCNVKCKR